MPREGYYTTLASYGVSDISVVEFHLLISARLSQFHFENSVDVFITLKQIYGYSSINAARRMFLLIPLNLTVVYVNAYGRADRRYYP